MSKLKPFACVAATMIWLPLMILPAAVAQVSQGAPRYSSVSGGPDQVNLSNFNVSLSIPILHRAGRGMDFSYGMSYNSAFYAPVTNGSTAAWKPSSSAMGWSAGGGALSTNYVYGQYSNIGCPGTSQTSGIQIWTNFIYVDTHGQVHAFSGTVSNTTETTCSTYPAGYTGFSNYGSPDHSGITLSATVASGAVKMMVTLPTGTATQVPWVDTVNAPDGSHVAVAPKIDNNGNYISNPGTQTYTIVGNSYQLVTQGGSYTDTLGNTALTIGTETVGFDGNISAFGQATYTYGSGSTAHFTPNYSSHNVQTNFGCSTTDYPATTPLLDSITLADGRSWGFTYEAGGGSNTTTGRIAKITLPGGGTVTYAYTTISGVSINCADGSPLGFTRTVTDGLGNSYVWTYQMNFSGANGSRIATVTDPTGASTIHTFYPIIGSLGPALYGKEYVEISTVAKDASGNVLKTVSVVYNGAAPSPTSPVYPITTVQTTSLLPSSSGVASGSKQVFNALGMPTETDVYDFGTAGSGTYGPLLAKTTTAYTLMGTLYDRATNTTSYGPNGSAVTTETTYGYDQTAVVATSGVPHHNTGTNVGNLTTLSRLVSGTSTFLTATSTYNDTGTVATSTDVNGATTSYTYNQCGDSLLGGSSTAVTANGVSTVTLSPTQTWNCGASTVASSVDLNGNTSTTTYDDPSDRPTSSEDPFGNIVSYGYPPIGGNVATTQTTFNSGASGLYSRVTYDGLSRPVLQQKSQGPSSTNWDSTAIVYNSIGLPSYSSMPYTAGSGTRTLSGPGVQTTYDGLGRTLQVIDGGGGYVQYAYTGNDVTVTTGPAPTGETVKVKVMEADGSGALKSVCEVTSQTGSGACGQYVAKTGYLTKYTNAPGVLTVQQNVQAGAGGTQTRTVNYDLAGRMTSESIPELGHNGVPGAVAYRFDSDSSGTCSGSYPGDLVYQSDAAGNVTCFTYDSQHRMLSSSVVSGPQASVTAQKHFVYDAASVDGTAVQNGKGTEVEAYTCASGSSCTTKLTDLYMSKYPEGTPGSYTGRVVQQVWESTPSSGGYYTSQATAYPNGARGKLTVAKISTTVASTVTLYIAGTERTNGPIPDQGLLMLTVNGVFVQSSYGGGSNVYSVAAALAAAVNATSSIPVTATSSGGTVTLTSIATGPGTGYPITVADQTTLPNFYTGSSFTLTASGAAMTIPASGPVLPVLTYGLDGEGRPNTVTDTTNTVNLVTAVAYNASSQATSVTYGNGDSDTFTPDPNTGRVTSYQNVITGSSAFTDTGALGWNANGSLHSFGWTDGNDATKNQSCTYSADALSRLASVNCGTVWAQTFGYDAFGNVTKTANGGSSYSAAYNAQTNQVSSGVTATYDANGNQTMTNLVSSISYDANHNAMTSGSTNMTYDALGRLVEFAGKPVVYGPSGEKLAIFNGTAYTSSVGLPGGGEVLYTSGTLTALRHKDWLGSSRVSTSWAHAVYSKTAYAPFGESYATAGTADLDFTGQTQDSVSTLFDFPARKYDPNAGRWTVPDPGGWSVVSQSNPQTFNRYAYVLNSPTNATDPTGLDGSTQSCEDTPDNACCQPVSDCEGYTDAMAQDAQEAEENDAPDETPDPTTQSPTTTPASTLQPVFTTVDVTADADPFELISQYDASCTGSCFVMPYLVAQGPGLPANPFIMYAHGSSTNQSCDPTVSHCGNRQRTKQACVTTCHRDPPPSPGATDVFTNCQKVAIFTILGGWMAGPWFEGAAAVAAYGVTNTAGTVGALICF